MTASEAFMWGVLAGWISLGVPIWVSWRTRQSQPTMNRYQLVLAHASLVRCRSRFATCVDYHTGNGETDQAETNRLYAVEAEAGIKAVEKVLNR